MSLSEKQQMMKKKIIKKGKDKGSTRNLTKGQTQIVNLDIVV